MDGTCPGACWAPRAVTDAATGVLRRSTCVSKRWSRPGADDLCWRLRRQLPGRNVACACSWSSAACAPDGSHHHMLLRRPSRLGRSRRPQVKLKPRGWFGARNALLRGRSKRSPRWRRLLWRFERSNSEVGRLRRTKAVACRRCLQLSFGRGYLLLQIFRDPGAQRPPKQGKLRHWVVVTVVVSRQLLAWHARYIHASIEEAGVDGGVERWWHPKGNNQTACRSRAE